jgi:hypothetical protein
MIVTIGDKKSYMTAKEIKALLSTFDGKDPKTCPILTSDAIRASQRIDKKLRRKEDKYKKKVIHMLMKRKYEVSNGRNTPEKD